MQDVGGVSVIAISPDGKQIAGAGDEGMMWQWDLNHPDAPPASLPGKLHDPQGLLTTVRVASAWRRVGATNMAVARRSYGTSLTRARSRSS